MLVDADKAKEKLAKVCEAEAQYGIKKAERSGFEHRSFQMQDARIESAALLVAADAIRQTDLTDCGVEVDTQSPWFTLRFAIKQGMSPDTKFVEAESYEALAAQVAELQKENQRILTSHVALMKEADARTETAEAQVAELKKVMEDARDYILHKAQRHDLHWRDGNAIIDRIDAAKEGK